MNFPGHRYFGPGNPVSNGRQVDEDDRIPQLHDREYKVATSDNDIRAADRVAIGCFTSDFIGTGNWHSAVGAFGLGLKYLGESVVGVQYHENMSGKNTALPGTSSADIDPREMESFDPATKRMSRDPENGAAAAMDIKSGGHAGSVAYNVFHSLNYKKIVNGIACCLIDKEDRWL